MNIYLIGLPGSGKSTVGARVASISSYSFVDLDLYIEQKACMFIDEIFELYGEEYFRALESNCLEELAKGDNQIISTGGGIIKNKNNKALMKGLCIFLDVSIEDLEKRINAQDNIRPLLKTKSLEELYNERIDLYNYFMDYRVLNNDLDITAKEILSYAEGFNN